MVACHDLFFKRDQDIGKQIGPLAYITLFSGLVALLAAPQILFCCDLLPLRIGLFMTGGAEGWGQIKWILLYRMRGEQGGTFMGAVHLSLREVTADAVDPFVTMEGASLCFPLMDAQRDMTSQATIFFRSFGGFLERLVAEGPGMSCSNPLLILLHMTGTAMDCLGSVMVFRGNPGKMAERGAARHEKHPGEENGNDSVRKSTRDTIHLR
jgi:hypothetical protein